MAVNVNEELQRPLSLGLASVALIGWLLAVCVWAYYSSQLGRVQDRLTDLKSRYDQQTVTLEQERSAAGTLSDITSKAEVAKEQLNQSVQARGQAEADLAQLQKDVAQARLQVTGNRSEAAATTKELADLRVQTAQARQEAAAAAKSLSDLQGQLRTANDQLITLRTEFAKTDQDRAAKAKAMEDLTREVKDATAQRDKLNDDVAAAEKQAAGKRAELARLEDQLAKARADLDKAEKARRQAPAQAGATPDAKPSGGK